MKVLTNLDMNNNQVVNLVLQMLAADPSPREALIYYNSDDKRIKYYNGTGWVYMDALGATMTGDSIVTEINGSSAIIDLSNLPSGVAEAITAKHSHTNSAVLDNTTASFTSAQETKIGYLTVTQSVDLDQIETDTATNNSKVSNATHTGDVTGSVALSIGANKVTNGMLAQVATQTFKGRTTASTGNVEDLTVAQAKAMLGMVLAETANATGFSIAGGTTSKTLTVNNTIGLSASNDTSTLNIGTGGTLGTGAFATAYVHPNHTGDVTSTADGATVIGSNKVANGMLAQMPANTLKGNNTAGTANSADLTATQVRTLLNVADGATANVGTVTSITPGNGMSSSTAITSSGTITLGTPGTITSATTNSVTTNSHTHALTVTKTDVGLANVTNDAQVKKLASSTSGNIPTWNGTTGDALTAGYSIETTLSGASTAIPRADAVKTYIDGILGANDAIIFKGTVGTSGTHIISAFNSLVVYNAGWSYKVIEAGTIKGKVCEIGDLLIATVDRASGGVDTDWVIIQTNIDGAVVGPASSTDGNFPIFSGTTGKLIADSSYGPTSFAASGHTHSTWDRATSVLSGANVFSDVVVTDGIVTAISTRALTAADIGAATSGHAHTAFDRATSVLSGANVFSDIVVTDGIVTAISTRSLTAANVGATAKYSTTVGDGAATSYVITHNLNTRDVTVTLRETSTPYAMVMTDIEFTTVNTLTVKFATAPTSGQYTITVIG